MKYLAAFIIAVSLVALPLAASTEEPATGQMTQSEPRPNACVPHDFAIDPLSKVFNEKVIGLGLGKNQQSVVKLIVSSKGSWTILVTLTNGMRCIAVAGDNWTTAQEQAELAS